MDDGIPSIKMTETKRKNKLRKKDVIPLRYINLACELPTQHSGRAIQQVVGGQSIHT